MGKKNILANAESYVMRLPRSWFRIGVACSLIFCVPLVLFLIFDPEQVGVFETIAFLLFASLGLFLAVYTPKWKIIVEKDAFMVYLPFRSPRTVTLGEITMVREKFNGIVVYVDDKKAFKVETLTSNYNAFCDMLYEKGKMEATQCQDSFVVRQSIGNLLGGALVMLLGIFFLILIVIVPDDPANPVGLGMYAFLSAFSILGIYLFAYALTWKITVSDDVLTFRKFTREKSYSIKDITKVELAEGKVTLFIGNKKLCTAYRGYEGVTILAVRLDNENVPVHRKGK